MNKAVPGYKVPGRTKVTKGLTKKAAAMEERVRTHSL
jgi:hypothetical protein